jgi:hypothetical protein
MSIGTSDESLSAPQGTARAEGGQRGGGRPGVKTRRGHRHPEYAALTAEQQVGFVANHDLGQRHSVFLEKPPSRRNLIGEAAVDVCGRRIGERLADALDEIVPYRREHVAQTRGDAGTEPDPRAAHQVRATAATGQQRSCSGEAVTSSVSSHSKPYKSCISDGLEQRTSIAP